MFVMSANKEMKMSDDMNEDPSILGSGGTYPSPPNQYDNYAKTESLTGQRMHRLRLQRLKDAKEGLEAKLAEVDKAIQLLEANPQMYELMEAIERAGV